VGDRLNIRQYECSAIEQLRRGRSQTWRGPNAEMFSFMYLKKN
jgi:hypothetical protein